MNTRLHGISFADLPHIPMGEDCIIVREEGELWDSDARPAYSVRMDGLHIGYIPLVETLREEEMRARHNQEKKKWKDEYENLTPFQLRAIQTNLNENGELLCFHEWVKTTADEARKIAYKKNRECEYVIIIRDHIRVEIMYNHLTPHVRALPLYFDKKHGRNYDEIGDICSISVDVPVDGHYENPLGTQTSAAKEAERASRSDQS